MILHGVNFPEQPIADFCQRHRVRRLALFGSILRSDFGPQSDVDVLVEFEPGSTPGFFAFGGMIIEFSAIIGRQADLRTVNDLSPYFAQRVLREARSLHAA